MSTRKERLARVTPFTRRFATNKTMAEQFLAGASFGRLLITAGLIQLPHGMGVEEFDAVIALISDIADIKRLSDAEFEFALRRATPPEFREVAQ
jgi:hypothetical protein